MRVDATYKKKKIYNKISQTTELNKKIPFISCCIQHKTQSTLGLCVLLESVVNVPGDRLAWPSLTPSGLSCAWFSQDNTKSVKILTR